MESTKEMAAGNEEAGDGNSKIKHKKVVIKRGTLISNGDDMMKMIF